MALKNVLAVLALLGAAAAAGAPATLKPLDIFDLELAVDPQISPDGRRVVYVRRFADVKGDRRHSNLWTIGTDGSGHRPLTTGLYTETAPRWSPDGRELAFVSDREGSPQIYRYWLETGQLARLTNLESAPEALNWSPDGQWLSFVAHVPEKAPSLIAMPAAPEGAKWADPPRVIDRLVYRFNAAGYLKPGFSQVFVLPAEGGTPRQVSSGSFPHAGPIVRASAPVWTPDGRYLILSANRHPTWEQLPFDTEVYEYRVADGAVRALTARAGPDDSAAVSPDGRRIAYVGYEDKLQGYQVRELYVMDRDGGGARSLSAGFDRDVAQPRWAPDGSGVYFLADDQGSTGLYLAPLAGPIRKLAAGIGATTNASGGTGASFSLARAGTFATVVTDPQRPGDVAVGGAAGAPLRVLTAVNEDLFAGRTLADCEELRYPSSKDQRSIHGFVLKPPGFDPAKKYPLILEIHGGPFANYGPRFDVEKQLMAAAGYVVLYTNPRGSTSYGGEFGNLIHHAYPGDDFYDLDAGVDALVARGYVDPEQLFVTGGSGGGVLTCWMIGHTTRFRAAAALYPVINWTSFVLTSDIGAWTSRYWFPGFPWDHAEHYEKRSLLSVVKNVKTPTLVLTGEDDYRTPMSDSEQYYQALKLLGVESVLVRVPEEPHGTSQRPSHHVAKVLHVVGWMDAHRPGAGSPPR